MLDQLTILAESGAEAAEGIPPAAIGIGMFVLMLLLLGATFLTSGSTLAGSEKESDDSSDH